MFSRLALQHDELAIITTQYLLFEIVRSDVPATIDDVVFLRAIKCLHSLAGKQLISHKRKGSTGNGNTCIINRKGASQLRLSCILMEFKISVIVLLILSFLLLMIIQISNSNNRKTLFALLLLSF